jgi:hypothetical protein
LFVATELLYNGLLIAVTAALIPAFGLKGAAISYLACQVGSFGWTLLFVRRVSNFRLTRANLLNLVGYGAAAGVAVAAAATGGLAAALSWIIAAATVMTAIAGLLRHFPEVPERLRRLMRFGIGTIA